ncbi:MAG TPA: flippase activity-associated protein Agl23, partial [Thermomicrobiaceae bacterium]|nr:flippase activity-associated protein Agl23 [Thermomicrobiaceae bacterium]
MDQIQIDRAGALELTRDRGTRTPSAAESSAIQRWLARGVTVESLLYAGILFAAILSRFWDLGSRALHHDESLHSYYSWLYAEGYGYQHNPLMHGPFLFHLNALLYLLFGANDYVTRIGAALAGVLIVMLPWLLRGRDLLGRWGALSASLLLLVSPSILYYSRFIRHDIYAALGAGLLFVTVVRYLEHPERRWVILGGITLAFMFTNHEVSFIVVFGFVLFLGGAIALRVAPALVGVVGGAVLALGVAAKILRALGVGPLPGIPWETPTVSQVGHYTVALITHPLVVAAVAIGLLALAAALRILDVRRGDAPWVDGLLGDAPDGSTAAGLRALLRDPRGLAIGAGIGALIWVALYTSLFSNMMGLLSGSIGSLGYWLGQQPVQRGEQPWFYYLLLMPQYEFVAVALFPIATGWTAWSTWTAWRDHVAPPRRVYVRGFLVVWSLVMLGVLSWGGEKMPWLTIHIALPMILLAAAVLGEAIERVERGWAGWSVARRGEVLGVGAGVIGLAAAGFLVMAWASAGPYVTIGQTLTRTVRPFAAAHWWLVYLPWLGLVA